MPAINCKGLYRHTFVFSGPRTGCGYDGSSLAIARLAGCRDTITPWIQPHHPLQATIVLKRISAFGPEICPIVDAAKTYTILTQRDSGRLNAFLRFPRQSMSGWQLLDDAGTLRGLAILNVIPKNQDQTRIGKIIDCLLNDIDINRWHAAILALTRELASQGADLVQAYASTPWTAEALHKSAINRGSG